MSRGRRGDDEAARDVLERRDLERAAEAADRSVHRPDGSIARPIRLSIGPEVYVSPTTRQPIPTTVTVRKLTEGEAFTIPPGQFAFLLTEEVVSVPADALAFISIRAKTKFRGLVNVSGFHVDPGYRGQLTFAVFNAGPVPIHLKRGQPIFLIWYASLDCETSLQEGRHGSQGHRPRADHGCRGRAAILRRTFEEGEGRWTKNARRPRFTPSSESRPTIGSLARSR